MDMKIKLEPINDTNREAVLALTVREDQLFVAPNDYSLSEADEANANAPGTARPFAIYAGEKLVGFCKNPYLFRCGTFVVKIGPGGTGDFREALARGIVLS